MDTERDRQAKKTRRSTPNQMTRKANLALNAASAFVAGGFKQWLENGGSADGKDAISEHFRFRSSRRSIRSAGTQ